MLFFVLPCGWVGAFGATNCLWLLVGYGETMRLRRYTGLAGGRVACGDYIFFVLPCGWVGAFGATNCLWLLVGYGETMRLRRYTGLAGDKGAHEGRLHIFLFCHAGAVNFMLTGGKGYVAPQAPNRPDGSTMKVCRAEGALSFLRQAPCLRANENGRRGGRPFGVMRRLFSCGAWAF